MPDHEHGSDPSPLRGIEVGYTLVAAIGLGFAVGWSLDRWLDSEPIALISCMLLFLVAGLYQVVKEFWPK